jgi:NAD(P)-dependent dehydrogenase (short-subunit alcohol dehydrogenase family)
MWRSSQLVFTIDPIITKTRYTACNEAAKILTQKVETFYQHRRLKMAEEFSGKVVAVSGATGNLGRVVVQRFAAGGATLVLLDRDAKRGENFAAEAGLKSYMVAVTDVANPESVDEMIRAVESRFGQIDVLAHTVGGFDAGKPVHEAGLEVFEKQINLNARPIVVLGGRIAKHMLEKNVQGKIVIVLAKAAFKGAKHMGAYTASKAAAQRLMESMSAELKDSGINVNAVAPSTIDTPVNRKDMPNADFDKWVKPEQLADAIAFLASSESNAIHAVTLEIYGRV